MVRFQWTESAPLVNAFGVWLDEQRSRVSPRSPLGEKLTYIANQWDRMLVFLHDGRVEMDSNFVENRIRPVKLTAKNALFAGHDVGALMGPYRLAHRDPQDERRRALRLAQDHAGEDRRRPSQQPHRRTPPLELQAHVKLKVRCLPRTAHAAAGGPPPPHVPRRPCAFPPPCLALIDTDNTMLFRRHYTKP